MVENINPEMTAEDVVGFIKFCQQHGIDVVIDGGWGVDALLGEQTRRHEDLDVMVQHKDVPAIRALLETGGYTDQPRGDSWECNFVLGDAQGHLVDIHACTFDAKGNNVFGIAYTLDALQGTGSINGLPVRCITPERLVEYHTGYPLDASDYHDVKLLCRRFDIRMPEEYAAFEEKESQS